MCAVGLTTRPTLTLFHTGIQFKDPLNTQQNVIGGGGEGAHGHVTGKKKGVLVSYNGR